MRLKFYNYLNLLITGFLSGAFALAGGLIAYGFSGALLSVGVAVVIWVISFIGFLKLHFMGTLFFRRLHLSNHLSSLLCDALKSKHHILKVYELSLFLVRTIKGDEEIKGNLEDYIFYQVAAARALNNSWVATFTAHPDLWVRFADRLKYYNDSIASSSAHEKTRFLINREPVLQLVNWETPITVDTNQAGATLVCVDVEKLSELFPFNSIVDFSCYDEELFLVGSNINRDTKEKDPIDIIIHVDTLNKGTYKLFKERLNQVEKFNVFNPALAPPAHS